MEIESEKTSSVWHKDISVGLFSSTKTNLYSLIYRIGRLYFKFSTVHSTAADKTHIQWLLKSTEVKAAAAEGSHSDKCLKLVKNLVIKCGSLFVSEIPRELTELRNFLIK